MNRDAIDRRHTTPQRPPQVDSQRAPGRSRACHWQCGPLGSSAAVNVTFSTQLPDHHARRTRRRAACALGARRCTQILLARVQARGLEGSQAGVRGGCHALRLTGWNGTREGGVMRDTRRSGSVRRLGRGHRKTQARAQAQAAFLVEAPVGCIQIRFYGAPLSTAPISTFAPGPRARAPASGAGRSSFRDDGAPIPTPPAAACAPFPGPFAGGANRKARGTFCRLV